MNDIILSIIIPHYNSNKTLDKLISTIPDLHEIEVIIVDDNSTKNVNQLKMCIEKYSMRNLKFLRNYTGINSAGTCRNIGLKEARGEWILFADSDDFFVDGWYYKVSVYFKAEYDMVFFTPTSIQIDTNKQDTRHIFFEMLIKNYIDDPSFINQLKLRYRFISPCCRLLKRLFLIENKIYFDPIISAEDVMFSVKCGYYSNKITASSEVIYCITRNKGSITTQQSDTVYFSVLNARINMYVFLRNILDYNELILLDYNEYGMKTLIGTLLGHNLKRFIASYRKLKDAKMPVFSYKALNPMYSIKSLFNYITKKRRLRNYME